ncbi:MAG: HK97 gp10 family phage protein [Heliobacteriaceae bacterium]|jgi:HK97 gp10 family phage protein|nr:HK97 gp10 family phage protein [Heliobacteriaceae bacterium]
MAKSGYTWKMPDFSVITDVADVVLDKVGQEIVDEAQMTAPVKTGKYKRSIRYYKRSKQVIANAPYSAALEYGVRVRIIKPKNGKALKFEVGGETVFAKEVHQKARPARAIMRNAARHMQARVGAIFIDEFKRKMISV